MYLVCYHVPDRAGVGGGHANANRFYGRVASRRVALVESGFKAGSTSDYCSLAIAITTGSASSRDRKNSIILYCVEQRLR